MDDEDFMKAGRESDGKADNGKVRMSLLFVQFAKQLRLVAEVLTFGAKKYPKPPLDDSWRDVPNAEQRYQDALYRHLHKAFTEGGVDEESGIDHLSHAFCNLLFIQQLRDKDTSNKGRCDGPS